LWEEPFGIVQIEAMAARKALVASDSSTTRYLQTLGLQSLLAKADSPQDWCKQITVLLDNERLRCEFAELNLAGAKQFDWVTVADQYAKMYADCLAKSKESGLS
jgi:1,4-alpha-glucan branching enzyme